MSDEVLSSHEYDTVVPSLMLSEGVRVFTDLESNDLLKRDLASLSGAFAEAIFSLLWME